MLKNVRAASGGPPEPGGTPAFKCLNCDGPVASDDLYCSDLCRDEAKYVRYHRACIADGRISQPDVKEALRIRHAMILGGGYPEQKRKLPAEIRVAVQARAAGTCEVCGAPGTEIDHIAGSGSDLSNLRLLCGACHDAKTIASFVPLDKAIHTDARMRSEALLERVYSSHPLRMCDRADWSKIWRGLARERKESLSGSQGAPR